MTTSATTVHSPGIGTDNDYNFCSAQNPCDEGQGDCDNDSECKDSLVCGYNGNDSENCRQIHGNLATADADCCIQNMTTNATTTPSIKPTSDNTDEEKEETLRYCSPNVPEDEKCKEGDGDCDSDDDCKGDLVCGFNNCKDHPKYQLDQDFKKRYPKADCCETVNQRIIGNFSCGVNITGNRGNGNILEENNLCGYKEGNCNSESDCKGSLLCGFNNCKDFNDKASEDSNCCYSPLLRGKHL